jgi:quercetin dioxygenase-like cupin family protein
VAIVDGEEHPLRQWDYFHCPPGVPHVVVGAGEEPALVLAVGSRVGGGGATYPNDADPRAAYEAYGPPEKVDAPL